MNEIERVIFHIAKTNKQRQVLSSEKENLIISSLMLFVPWKIDSSDTDDINFKSMYATHLNLITQNRELFESRDQSSIDEAINIELNFDGIAIEEIMNNEVQWLLRILTSR